MPAEFTELRRNGMKAYRGLYNARYTYVRNHDGPWLLYDNEKDPYQMSNLAGISEYSDIQAQLELCLQRRLKKLGDTFLESRAYLERDGLSHYGEVNAPCKRIWRDPWREWQLTTAP
jgi:hypothetical protein